MELDNTLLSEDDDELLTRVSRAFAREEVAPLFPEPSFGMEVDEEPSLWDTTDWATGEALGSTRVLIKTDTQQEQGEETFEQSTPGSSASFQAAEAATFDRWYAQDNGRIPLERLFKVAPGHYLRKDAGKNMKAMIRAARKDGIAISYTDTYRDFAAQVDVKRRKGAYAATPGTSNHGWGMAVDFNVNDPKTLQWMQKNAGRFGWENPDWAHDGQGIEEPWHWEYVGGGSHKIPVQRKDARAQRLVTKARKTQVSVEDLDEPSIPLSGKGAFANAILSLAIEEPAYMQKGLFKKRTEVDPEGLPKALQQAPAEFRKFFIQASRKSGLPIKLLLAVAAVETGGGTIEGIHMPDGANSAGAVGPMQVIPKWHPDHPNLDQARGNIIAGARILASYMDGLGLKRGLAAYNAGPNNLSAGMDYAAKVLEILRSL